MAAEPREQPMSLEEFATHAAEVFERLERDGGSVLVGQGDVLFTVRPKRRRARRNHTPQPPEHDPFFDVAGIGHSDGPGEVGTNKHKYLADAYADLHDSPQS